MSARVGIIGTQWGRMHIGAFRAAGAEVVALCGRSEEKTRAIAAEEGIALATTDVHALCAQSDLVVVASPDAHHAEHIRQAWSHGRAVLCEKPLTFTSAEAFALAAEAARQKERSAMCFPYRLLEPLRAAKAWLETHPPRWLRATVRNGFAAASTDASADFGGASHVVDAALWLAGRAPRSVQAAVEARSLSLHLQLEDGARVIIDHLAAPQPGIHGGWSAIGDGWELGFSAGYVPERGGWCISPVRLFHEARWTDLAPGAEPGAGTREPWAHAYVSMAKAFLAGAPLPTFDDGARVQQIFEAAVTSERLGRRVGFDTT